MPKRVEITVAPDTADELLAALAERDEVLSLTVERGAGLRPAGDAIRLIVPNRWLPELLRMLRERGIGRDEKSLLSTSETLSVVQAPSAPLLQRDTNDASWEEVDAVLNAEAGANANVVGLITLAGALAALGLATGALHLVIAAMVVAPGFEPIARIGLALTTRGRT